MISADRARKVAIVTMVVLSLVIFFYVWPILLVGPPLPLYNIHNKDNTSHEVTIKIYDSRGEVRLNKTYVLGPGEGAGYPGDKWDKLQWDEGAYTFNITMENGVTREDENRVHNWNVIHITLYNRAHRTNEIIPISIGYVTV